MDLERVAKEGKYYYPASSHYQPNSVVICDRCQSRGLIACIGLDIKPDEFNPEIKQLDLCLECANELATAIKMKQTINERPKRPEILTLMMQSSMMTRMEQSMMRNRNQVMTKMQQSMMRPRTPMTRMEQSMTRPRSSSSSDDQELTFMEQSMFKYFGQNK